MTHGKQEFLKYKALAEKYNFISGWMELVKSPYENGLVCNGIGNENIYSVMGSLDMDALKWSLNDEHPFTKEECDPPKKEGIYTFEMLLQYNEEQRGDYPPPNIEACAYYDVFWVEFEWVCTKDNWEKPVGKAPDWPIF